MIAPSTSQTDGPCYQQTIQRQVRSGIAWTTPTKCPTCRHRIIGSWKIYAYKLKTRCVNCLSRIRHRWSRPNSTLPTSEEATRTNYAISNKTPTTCPTCQHWRIGSWRIYFYGLRTKCQNCTNFIIIFFKSD